MIAAILTTTALYFWFPNFEDETGSMLFDRHGVGALGLMAGIVLLTLFAIMNFKKRQLQFVLNRLSILLNFVLLGVFVYRSLNLPGENLISEKGIGMLLPVISIVFLVLANKAIKRDEDLVKSVDRLR